MIRLAQKPCACTVYIPRTTDRCLLQHIMLGHLPPCLLFIHPRRRSSEGPRAPTARLHAGTPALSMHHETTDRCLTYILVTVASFLATAGAGRVRGPTARSARALGEADPRRRYGRRGDGQRRSAVRARIKVRGRGRKSRYAIRARGSH